MPNTATSVKHLTKIYKLYDKPVDRLKEALHPLKKQYHKEFYALNDVSFEIKKGEIVGIIGKNIHPRHHTSDTRHPVLDTESISSYKDLITYVEDRARHDRRYAIDATKIKTIQYYLEKYTK